MTARDEAAPRPGREKTRTWHGLVPECGAATRKKAEDGGGAGAPCRLPAGSGTSHKGVGRCRFHGGSTESGIKNAARVKAQTELRAYNEPHAVVAREALQQELDRANGHVQWLTRKLSDPDPRDPEVAAWLRLYGEERERLAKVAEAGLRANLEERHLEVIEKQAEIVVDVIRGVLQDLGVYPYRVKVVELVQTHLRAVGARAEAD